MEKIDAHKFRKEVQRALRDQVIRLRKQGKTNKDVAKFLGMSPAQQYRMAKVRKGRRKRDYLGNEIAPSRGKEESHQGTGAVYHKNYYRQNIGPASVSFRPVDQGSRQTDHRNTV
ncbi:MAG: hypothetical protein A4E58_01010 [Syntrophorhabdus sp. PtaB.Bin006]|nr:MAG: hypothetical protein A4E58_01010 [Syntrophorhabdus sp. PtaB.Bin006]